MKFLVLLLVLVPMGQCDKVIGQEDMDKFNAVYDKFMITMRNYHNKKSNAADFNSNMTEIFAAKVDYGVAVAKIGMTGVVRPVQGKELEKFTSDFVYRTFFFAYGADLPAQERIHGGELNFYFHDITQKVVSKLEIIYK